MTLLELERQTLYDPRYAQCIGQREHGLFLADSAAGLVQGASLELQDARFELARAIGGKLSLKLLNGALDTHGDAFMGHIEAIELWPRIRDVADLTVIEVDMVAMAMFYDRHQDLRVPAARTVGELITTQMYSHRAEELKKIGKRPHIAAALAAFRQAVMLIKPANEDI